VVLAGAVPVPIYPPAQLNQLEAHLTRQTGILDNAGARMLVTLSDAMLAARLLRPRVASLRHVTTVASLVERGHQPLELPSTSANDVALIQYTSGSTGDPKGVVITNEQLLSNIRSMGAAVDIDTSDLLVSWLPLYHDMGLIGCWHTPLYFGVPMVVMSPLAFLAHPVRWLDAVSTFEATLTVGPNFAYQRCVDRVSAAQSARLDLSSLRVAINGSEPVSPATVRAFTERFASCGFDPGALCPAYGLAEMGVGVTFTDLASGPVIDVIDRGTLQSTGVATLARDEFDSVSLVSCGRPLEGYAVRIIGSDGSIQPERHEGAITCRGPSATQGYFNNERATCELWHDGWLETGDLGYVVDGRLFVTGRTKDVIIRAGRNLHPEELEEALGTLDGVVARGVAVLSRASARTGTAQIVVVAETEWTDERRRRALERAITERTLDELGVAPDEVVLVRPATLLRTASGKLRRGATIDALDAGTLTRAAPPVVVQLARFAATGVKPLLRAAPRFVRQCARDAVVALVVVPAGFVAWLLSLAPLTTGQRTTLARRLGRLVCRLLGIDVEVRGTLLPCAPVILAANHASLIDGIVMFIACEEPVVFVTSVELQRTRVVGTLLGRYGCVFVQRGLASEGAKAVELLVGVVRDGRRLVIFPEGSLSGAADLRSFHLGAFETASSVPCPVVPVSIVGTRDILAPGSFHLRPGTVRIVAGPAIEPRGDELDARVALRDAVRDAIASLGERPR
jgi:1-acyl-sn-glycerol-3-phosphate acyltransferase